MSDKDLAETLRKAADKLDPPGWGKIYNDPKPPHSDGKNCWRRFKKHRWSEEYRSMYHAWKVCLDCGHVKRTKHLSCGVACWGGPG